MTKKFIVNDIVCSDSKKLSEFIKPNSVSLTITSPPYRNAINYSQHVKNNKNSNDQFRGNVGISTSDYLDEMEKIFSEVYKVTTEGGICCIVIGDEVVNGKLIPLPSHLISRLVTENDDGWNLRDVIIWNKVTAGRNGSGNRFGIFIQHPFPYYYRSNIMHESIIVLQKGKRNTENIRKPENRIPLNRAMKRQVSLSVWDLKHDAKDEELEDEYTKSIWDITPVPPRVIDHPAVFPEQIPWRLITLYSKEGDVVLDPMNGSGQTTKIAKKLNRKFIGVDKRKLYVNLAKKRLKESFQLSNFMIPVYLPIEWSQDDQSGKKEDAMLDITIPKEFEFKFQESSDKEVLGIRGMYFYYQNKRGDWLCYIFGRSLTPRKMKLGNLSNPQSDLQKVLLAIPKNRLFKEAELNQALPSRLIENRQPIKALIDILAHEGFLKKESKQFITTELFKKILPRDHSKPKKVSNLVKTS